ncbi:MAG: hypothetical protein RIC51_11270 [Erythrobacter sp.]|uniref:hypothetical protein n=1 Tax=Erythrobacter sp. TaxID=1042 RepID=UPI0032EBBFDF
MPDLPRQLRKNRLWPLAAFLAVAALGWGAHAAIGGVYSGAEARQLLEALSRAGLYLGSAIVTGSATTLALMLTMVGMIDRLETEFNREAYENVNMVAKLATGSLLLALIVLLAFTLPVGEFEDMPERWFQVLYDALFAGAVAMVGMMAATVVMIYLTLRRVLAAVTPGDQF